MCATKELRGLCPEEKTEGACGTENLTLMSLTVRTPNEGGDAGKSYVTTSFRWPCGGCHDFQISRVEW